MKITLCTILAVAGLAVQAIDTNADKFFNHNVGSRSVKLPQNEIYPKGRLFPFSFYSVGGGSETKRGDLLPEAQRLADQQQIIKGGVTMIGPQYELNHSSLETARQNGIKMIYTIQPVIDGVIVDRKYLLKLAEDQKKIDIAKLKESVASIVKAVADRPEIAWWDITPEELRYWVPDEVEYLKTVYETIKENDPLKRPAFMYEPGQRTAEALAKLLPWQDLSAKGMYLNYSGKKDQRVWARFSTEQEVEAVKKANRPEVVPLALPEMFQQPKDNELKLIRDWVRHDVYCALVNGAKGVLVFSASRRPNFAAREKYLQAYLEVCGELTGPKGLGQVFLFGKPMRDLEFAVVEGPAETVLKDRKGEVKYPSVSMANYSWENRRYVFLVNSSGQSLKVIVSGLVYGSGVTVRSIFEPKTEFTAPEGDFEVELKPFETAGFEIYWKK